MLHLKSLCAAIVVCLRRPTNDLRELVPPYVRNAG
jgi:hypothetical protein